MAEPVRMVEESEKGLLIFIEIIAALLYLAAIPVLLIVDLIRQRRPRGRHRA